jgi:hypothetical protein
MSSSVYLKITFFLGKQWQNNGTALGLSNSLFSVCLWHMAPGMLPTIMISWLMTLKNPSELVVPKAEEGSWACNRYFT